MTLNSRIKSIRKELSNDSTKELASILNVSSQAVSNYVRDGYNIGREVIENLLSAFPGIDANWLLTGNGEMLKTDLPKIDTSANEQSVPYFLYKDLLDRNERLARENERLTELLNKNGIDYKKAI